MLQSDFKIEFEKLHACSNDFIFICSSYLAIFQSPSQLKKFVKFICDRNQGVGADGVVFYSTDNNTKYLKIEILIINSDGSFAATCGNALRCLALKIVRDKIWNGQSEIPVFRYLPKFILNHQNSVLLEEQFIFQKDYFALLINTTLNSVTNAHVSISVNREIVVKSTELIEKSLLRFGAESNYLQPVYVELSNPHWVFISSEFRNFNQKLYEEFGLFAQKELPTKALYDQIPIANIGMLTLQKENMSQWDLVVFERGAGLTKCCGSGAVAARIALESYNFVTLGTEKIYFHMPGGVVSVSQPLCIDNQEGQRILTGTAQWVFAGNLSFTK